LKKIPKNMTIGFIGLSHLGLVSSISASEKGFNIIGYDDKSELIVKLNKGITELEEPNLIKIKNKNKRRIKFTNDPKNLNKCDLVYFSKDIKTNKKNVSDFKSINSLINKVKKHLNKRSTLIMLSQITPGFTRKIKWPKDKLYYQVETLIFGKAIKRSLSPERIIVGKANEAVKINLKYMKFLKKFNCPILTMNYESAELTKIAINLFLISSIVTSNKLSEISSNLGANYNKIKSALKLDKRIGRFAYLNPGLGIAGGNLERDLINIIKISKKHHIDKKLFDSWNDNSNFMKEWAYRKFKRVNKKNIIKKISILGITYKENTNSIKNSPAIELITKLRKYKVNIYDPVVKINFTKKNLINKNSISECLKDFDVLFIMTPWKKFKNYNFKKILKKMKSVNIIDPYGVINDDNLTHKNLNYYSITKTIN
tara:strand:+ start:12870 stop:14150 length:1281 start_codon:yes stop_codon:yes gene_type:complete